MRFELAAGGMHSHIIHHHHNNIDGTNAITIITKSPVRQHNVPPIITLYVITT
jgi:hypothetical protein